MENQFYGSSNSFNSGQPPLYMGGTGFPPNNPEFEKNFIERNEIRRRTRVVGIPVIILMLAFSFFSSILITVLLELGISHEMISNIFGNSAITSVYSVLLACLFFGVPFVISAKFSGFCISELVPLGLPEKGTALPMLLIGVSFCGFANVMAGMADSFFSGLGFEYSLPSSEVPSGIFGFMISFLSTAVEPALMEEFAMRGIVLGIFRRYGDGFAIVSSAVIFGLMHGNFSQIPFAFLVGLVLGFIRVKSDSLWIACAVHSLNNFIAVIFDYIPSSEAANLWYGVYLMLCMLMGAAGILIINKRSIKFKLNKGQSSLSFAECSKAVFSHPLIIIFAIICLLEAVMYWEPIASFIGIFI